MEITKDDSMYLSLTGPLETIRNIGMLLTAVSAAGCFVVLYMLMAMQLRTRKKEMGIFISSGIGKNNVMLQMVLEMLIICAAAFVFAAVVFAVISVPAGDAVNSMFFAGAGDGGYTVTVDAAADIDINMSAASDGIAYQGSIESIFISAFIGISSILLPIIWIVPRMLRTPPKELLY